MRCLCLNTSFAQTQSFWHLIKQHVSCVSIPFSMTPKIPKPTVKRSGFAGQWHPATASLPSLPCPHLEQSCELSWVESFCHDPKQQWAEARVLDSKRTATQNLAHFVAHFGHLEIPKPSMDIPAANVMYLGFSSSMACTRPSAWLAMMFPLEGPFSIARFTLLFPCFLDFRAWAFSIEKQAILASSDNSSCWISMYIYIDIGRMPAWPCSWVTVVDQTSTAWRRISGDCNCWGPTAWGFNKVAPFLIFTIFSATNPTARQIATHRTGTCF